jgi:hypothetical protein
MVHNSKDLKGGVHLQSRCIWQDNIKIGTKVLCFGGVDWIHLAGGKELWRAGAYIVMK